MSADGSAGTARQPGTAALLAGLVLVCVLAALLATAGPAAAASSAAAPAASPGGKVVLRVGVTQDVNSINPFIGFTDTAYDVLSQNYEFLVERRPEDYMPGPDGIAESWESSADGRVWTFHLHDGITWQDGVPLTADDVVFTFKYILDNDIESYAGAVRGITDVVQVDDHTVRIVTEQPKADILSMWVPIVPKHVWEKISPQAATTSFQNPTPVGSGPFRVTEWKPGSYLILKANPDYWQGAPAVDEVIYQVYENANTMVDDLVTGAIDAAQGIPPANFRKLQSEPGIRAIAYVGPGWDHVTINCYGSADSLGSPVLRDPRFRVAIDYAIDRDKLVSVAYQGLASPGTTVLPSGFWSDPDYHWQPPAGVLRGFDLQKARTLLDQAGYRDADGDGVREYRGEPIRLRLWAPSGSTQLMTTGKLLTGWLRDAGLDISYRIVDEGVINDAVWNYRGDTYAPDYDLYLWSWGGMADPGQTLDGFTSAQIEGWNETCWSDAAYDRACTQQMQEPDAQRRAVSVHECQRIMYGANPESVTVYPRLLQAVNVARWDGWVYSTIEGGQAFYRQASQKTFLAVHPVDAAGTGGASRSWIWVLAALAALAVVGSALLLRHRAHTHVDEEA